MLWANGRKRGVDVARCFFLNSFVVFVVVVVDDDDVDVAKSKSSRNANSIRKFVNEIAD